MEASSKPSRLSNGEQSVMNLLARRAAAVLFALIGALFFLMAISLPSDLKRQAEKDRIYYQQFRQAATYAAAYARQHKGLFPSDEELQALGDTSNALGIWASLSASGGECDGGFKQDPTDQFTLWFWRGEWGECFAYPSGKTTLSMSATDYFSSGMWLDWAIWWLVAIASGYAAFRLAKRRPPSSAR